jgi:hypothetical protein
LADYPNIADWNDGIKTSYATSEATDGVGAKRHCDLAPLGALEETVTAWDPEDRMVISIDSASKIPIKRGEMTFTLNDADETTDFAMSYDYEPRGGFIGNLLGRLIDGQLRKGFTGFLDQLESAAQTQATA